MPAVNQIEVHPYCTNDAVRAFGDAHGIATEAWSPIAQGDVLDDPVITAIADRLGRSPAQVVLRWHIQRGNIVFPKSTTPARIEENFDLFDFELDADDVAAIDALDRGEAGRRGGHTPTASPTSPSARWLIPRPPHPPARVPRRRIATRRRAGQPARHPFAVRRPASTARAHAGTAAAESTI